MSHIDTSRGDSCHVVTQKLLGLMLLLASGVAAAIPNQSGSLAGYLTDLQYGRSGDEIWVEPTPQEMAWFGAAMDAFIAGDYHTAHQLGGNIGYEVLIFSDTDTGQLHYILQEKMALDEPGFRGGGTYVKNPLGREFVVEAPHPRTDLYTERQAVELYLAAQPRYLALAGTRRDSTIKISGCSGNHPKSDASHHTAHLYYVAHERLNALNPNWVFVQLHGFGSSSLKKLQRECKSSNPLLVNLSEGVQQPIPSTGTFMRVLHETIMQDEVIQSCLYGEDTRSLGALTNTTGRYSNRSSDPCLISATQSTARFVHVEQSYKIRSAERQRMNAYIKQAMDKYIP